MRLEPLAHAVQSEALSPSAIGPPNERRGSSALHEHPVRVGDEAGRWPEGHVAELHGHVDRLLGGLRGRPGIRAQGLDP